MTYQLLILPRAQKELGELPAEIYTKVRDKVYRLASSPRPSGCKKLVARPAWRIRVGNYRVIYEINDKARVVLVVHIGHRRDVY